MTDLPIPLLILLIFTALLVLINVVPILYYLPTKLKVRATGGDVSIFNLFGMDLRKTPKKLILDTHLELIRENSNHVHVRAIELIYLDNREEVQTSSQLAELVSGCSEVELDEIMERARTNKGSADRDDTL